jgi:hypothetical protein
LEVIAYQFQPLLDSIRAAVKDENWLAGLALTLMLPDICGKIETPKKCVGQRYARWWDKNFKDSYQYGPNDHVKGEEVYQLRCAYLHEGRELQANKKEISATIEKFKFVASAHHLEKDGKTVLLHVKQFCEDMCSRVEDWEKDVLSQNSRMQHRADALAKIYFLLQMPVGAISITAAPLTVRYMRTCTNCGSPFPQEEHESLCGDCR